MLKNFTLFRQRIGDERGGGNFDHRADLQVFVERDFFGAQPGLALFDERVGLVQLVQPGDHRIHHLDVALGAGAEDGAELGAEHFRLGKAEPDCAPAEKRVHLLRELEVRGEFVAAQVQRADDDGMRLQRDGDLAINLVLLVLGRQAVAVDEQKFRAEQADALRAVRENRLDVVLVLDVRGKVDGLAIERDGGLVLDFAEFFIERRLDLRELAVFKQRLVGGIDDDRAVVAVEQRVVAGLQFLADGLRADDGGDVQRPGENRGVRGLAADVGDEAEDKFFVQLRRHGRAQIVADEDAWLVQMLQVKGCL